MLRSFFAHLVLGFSLGFTLCVASLCSVLGARRRLFPKRILVVGTFHNPNWFLSHATPLARSGIDEVIVVTETPQPPVDRVRFVCPPPWALRLLGRTFSKLVWMVITGVRSAPNLYMGFHIFPGALSALIVARIFRRPACYQMTGGPVEIIGGGFSNENRLMSGLGRPSSAIERLALSVLRQFDLVIVRGSKAKRFLAQHGMNGTVRIITGSILPQPSMLQVDRRVDLIFVGRMAELKQPEQFVRVVAAVARSMPNVRAMMVGTGPELQALQTLAVRLGVNQNIEFVGQRCDVSALLAQSRIFVLTSRSEGLSIAMAEAMSHGVPPVVANVGELSDLVVDGVNGRLVPPGDVDAYARGIIELLSEQARWDRFSRAARAAALDMAAVEMVARRWSDSFRCLTEQPGERVA